MIRMGNMPEKTLLFRAFIDDYEEFDYEKRGSFDVTKENIYDRVVRLCKNAKSRQDRAKQKLLDECQVYEYPHILLVEYQADKSSTLTGLVANELANKYCKPCIVFHRSGESADGNETHPVYSGSIRNYDGSPISSFKAVLEFAFENKCDAQGHDNAAGFRYYDNLVPDEFEKQFSTALFSSYWDTIEDVSPVAIGEKEFQIDFSIPADALDAGFIQKLHWFERYSGCGFAPVTALVTGIKVCQENFKTIGKNTFNWKISDEDTGVSFVKFKIDRQTDELVQKLDDFDIGATTYFDTGYVIDAICTFGLNVYNGEIHPQAVIKDYVIRDTFKKESFDDDDDFDLDFDL
jgi:single-stranded-DNA-specific exonuclease